MSASNELNSSQVSILDLAMYTLPEPQYHQNNMTILLKIKISLNVIHASFGGKLAVSYS